MALFLLAVAFFIGVVAWISVLWHRRDARRHAQWAPSFELPPPPPRPTRASQSTPQARSPQARSPAARAQPQQRRSAVSKLYSASNSEPVAAAVDLYPQQLLQIVDDDSRRAIGGGGAFGGAGASGTWGPSGSHEATSSHSGVDTCATTVETAAPSVDTSGGGGCSTVDAGTFTSSD